MNSIRSGIVRNVRTKSILHSVRLPVPADDGSDARVGSNRAFLNVVRKNPQSSFQDSCLDGIGEKPQKE
jgi:hypothetical protein